ncbi:MAG: BatA and WFA domain-containing protein [Vicingaceae bacterium]
MNFLYPSFFFALSALAIPIVIHLYNFRRYKRISFTNVSILKEIETSSKSVRRLRNLLTLVMRLLALFFLVLAFTQPFIPAKESPYKTEKDAIVIVLDNSMSMGGFVKSKSKFEIVKELAHSVLDQVPNAMAFHLMTNEFRQSDFTSLSLDEIRDEIHRTGLSPISRKYADFEDRLKALSGKVEGRLHVYLISDFQINQFEQLAMALDTNIQLNLISIPDLDLENIALDSCWALNPSPLINGRDSIGLLLTNYSENSAEGVNVRMYSNDQQVWMTSIDLPANAGKTIYAPMVQDRFGDFKCKFLMSEDDLDFDNELYFSYRIDSAVQVYYLGPEKFTFRFTKIYNSPFIFFSDRLSNIDVSKIKSSACVVISPDMPVTVGISDLLKSQILAGSSLIVFPASESKEYLNDFLQKMDAGSLQAYDSGLFAMSAVNAESKLLRTTITGLPDNPNLPFAKGRFGHKMNERKPFEDILSFQAGPAIRRLPMGSGNLYLFTFNPDLKLSNFFDHSIAIPLMLNAAFQGSSQRDLYHLLGQQGLIPVGNEITGEQAFHLVGEEFDIIPEIRRLRSGASIVYDDQIVQSGTFGIFLDGRQVRWVSFNHNRIESDPRCYDNQQLQDLVAADANGNKHFYSGNSAGLTARLSADSMPFSLWKYCVILALLFFIGELLVLKYMRT